MSYKVLKSIVNFFSFLFSVVYVSVLPMGVLYVAACSTLYNNNQIAAIICVPLIFIWASLIGAFYTQLVLNDD